MVTSYARTGRRTSQSRNKYRDSAGAPSGEEVHKCCVHVTPLSHRAKSRAVCRTDADLAECPDVASTPLAFAPCMSRHRRPWPQIPIFMTIMHTANEGRTAGAPGDSFHLDYTGGKGTQREWSIGCALHYDVVHFWVARSCCARFQITGRYMS